jgi:hypothetical protein
MNQKLRVALIGDSQSEVLWPLLKKSMPQHDFVLVRTQRGWFELQYKNEGKLAQELLDAKPDLVIVELGGNNYLTSAVKYQPAVDWMLNAARAGGARQVLWVGPAAAVKEPFKSNKEWTRGFQQQHLQTQPDVVWMDSFPYTQSNHADDGVHFKGSSVHRAWASAIEQQVQGLRQGDILPAGPQIPVVAAGAGVLLGGVLVALLLKRLLK